MVGSINNGFTIPGEKGPTVIAYLRSEPFGAAAVTIHGVDIEISRSHGGENDRFAVSGDCSFRVVTRIFRQSYRFEPVDVRAEDVVRRINGPDVPLASIRCRWASVACQMSRGIDELFTIRKEKAASRAPFAAVWKFHIAPVDIHAEDLIALEGRPGGLEDELCTVEGKVRFGILPAEGELLQVLEMLLPRFRRWTWERVFGSDETVTDGDQQSSEDSPNK